MAISIWKWNFFTWNWLDIRTIRTIRTIRIFDWIVFYIRLATILIRIGNPIWHLISLLDWMEMEKRVSLTAIFRARLSAFFLAANFFSVILFSMMASSSLVKGRKVGRLLSDSFSAWFSDMVGSTSSGSGSRYHLEGKSTLIRCFSNILHNLLCVKLDGNWQILHVQGTEISFEA